MFAADALALSRVADLKEIGLPPATATAAHFSHADALEPEPELLSPDEPEPEPPFGPMAGFDERAVQRWLGSVPGLTAAQRAAAAERTGEDEYDGPLLLAATTKTLGRLLKASGAEGAVSLLLAARDAQLEAEEAAAAAREPPPAAAPGERPSCPICMEPYSAAGGVVPRMLVACGHDFCEGCLDAMLRPLLAKKGRKQLPCPTYRTECAVKGGRAAQGLPIVYALRGP